jgi:hypothetical protein
LWTGKSATAEVLANTLGCVSDGPWDSVYPEPAAKFDTETVNDYFEPATSPFRFVVPRGKFLVAGLLFGILGSCNEIQSRRITVHATDRETADERR